MEGIRDWVVLKTGNGISICNRKSWIPFVRMLSVELTCSQGNLTLNKFESSKKSHKGQHRTHPRFWCGDYYCQVITWYGNPSRRWPIESLNWSHKGQHQTCWKFWWVEDHSLYSYNMMQANSETISDSQGPARCWHLNMT